MRTQDWVGLAAIVASIAAGALFIGQLQTEVRELRRQLEARGPIEAINEVLAHALDELRASGQSVVAESLRGEADVQVHSWHQSSDNSPKRMLSISEGICFLTTVSGRFEGGGEFLTVGPSDDGQWIFRGGSRQSGVQGDVYCWRFPWASR